MDVGCGSRWIAGDQAYNRTLRSVMDRHDGIDARPSRRKRYALIHRSLVVWMTLLLVLFSGPSPTFILAGEDLLAGRDATAGASESLREKLNRRGYLDLENTPITEAISTISRTWDVNIVVQSDLKGDVNGVFKKAPLKEILDSLLLINGYSYRAVGESLVVMKLEEVGEVSPLFTTAIIPLRYGVPEEILPVVNILKSPRGRVQAIPSSRSLMVVDFPHHVEMIRRHTSELDKFAGQGTGAINTATTAGGNRIEVAHFATQYIPAIHLEKVVADLLSDQGKASVVEKENQIVVADFPERLRLVAETVRHLDVPRRQVRIAAFIYDISLEDIEEIGINWNSALKGNNLDAENNPQDVFAIDSITQVPPALGAANGIMTFMSLSRNFDVTAVVNALQQSDDSRLLADPNVTVLDNDQARIEIITEIPYQELTQTSGGGNIGTTSFREAGVRLQVTPRIAADGTIEMNVTPSFSRLTGFTPGDNQPIIDRREASTTIRVADQQTVVIGGLRQRSDVGDFTGIPILKDIPIAGKLFRNRATTVRESELVVFITPIIVPYDDYPHGRYAAALDTTECWLHRVPWAEGCPPFGHPDCPEHCGDEYDFGEGMEVIHDESSQEQPQRLPEVQEPVLPPQDYGAQSSRRRGPVPASPVPAVTSPASPTRTRVADPGRAEERRTRTDAGGHSALRQAKPSMSKPETTPAQNVPRIELPQPPRPAVVRSRLADPPRIAESPVRVEAAKVRPSSEQPKAPVTNRLRGEKSERGRKEVPRVKLARKSLLLPHDASPGSEDIPRRLPPVVAQTHYQSTIPSSTSKRPDDRPDYRVHIPTNGLRQRTSEQLRKPYSQRFQTQRHIEGQSLIENEIPRRLPPVARNPSVSPDEAARQRDGSPTRLPAVFDAFRP